MNSNLQNSNKKTTSNPHRYSLEKLFPGYKPTPNLTKKPERNPHVLPDKENTLKRRGENNSNSTVLDIEKDKLIKPFNDTFSEYALLFSRKKHRKRKFNEINHNNERSGGTKKTQLSTYFNKDTSFFKEDYDSSSDDDYIDENDNNYSGYSS